MVKFRNLPIFAVEDDEIHRIALPSKFILKDPSLTQFPTPDHVVLLVLVETLAVWGSFL